MWLLIHVLIGVAFFLQLWVPGTDACQNRTEDIHYSYVIIDATASQITSLTIVYSPVYSGADQRHQSSASLAFVRDFTGDRWIPRTNGQLRGKWFHLMTSPWPELLGTSSLSLFAIDLTIRYFTLEKRNIVLYRSTHILFAAKSILCETFINSYIPHIINDCINFNHFFCHNWFWISGNYFKYIWLHLAILNIFFLKQQT